MANEARTNVREKTRQILLRLTLEEQRVFSAVIKIEREYLHQKRPRIRDDVLKAVREIVKEATK